MAEQIEGGTPGEHYVVCNADRSKPVGCDMCVCPRLKQHLDAADGAELVTRPPDGLGVSDAIPYLKWLKPWKWYLMAAFLAFAGLQSFRLEQAHTKIATLKGEAKEAEIRYAIQADELKKCQGTIDATNQLITDAAEKSKKIVDDFNDFKREIALKEQKANQQIEDLKRTPAPKTCEAAEQFLRDHLGGK